MKLINADCIEAMKAMPDNSVDSIVTDPPYELGFMGKSWDASGIAFNVDVWREALRVIKPGGHLIAFSGSRTYHRMAVAIEDAGFQIRDQIMWVYGSGFPKSHNISKGIDKSDAVEMRLNRQLKFCEWMRSTGLTSARATEILRAAKVISENGTMAGHFFATSIDGQPAVATAELFNAMRPFLPEVPEWVEQMVRERTVESENFKKREVVGSKKSGIGTAFGDGEWASGQAQDVNITAPATAAAKQWDGWGTALKPAHEPMVLARKPLEGTVANNVLTYGVGGLNIDATRVGSEERFLAPATPREGTFNASFSDDYKGKIVEGRFPANFIHDGSDEVVALFPEAGNKWKRNYGVEDYEGKQYAGGSFGGGGYNGVNTYADSGSAARFFYCAKASKRDRNEGLEGFEAKRDHDGRKDGGVGGDNPRNRTNNAKLNHHPTVKPTSLMQYLVRLVTPPNGIVLDPFMGSGSTGKACAYEGFDFIGIDQSAEYVEIAQARIDFALANKADELEL